jgi:hypothetical protein
MLVSGSCPDSRSQQLVPANEVRDFRDEGAFEAFHPDGRAYDPSLWRSLREPETNGTPVQVATMGLHVADVFLHCVRNEARRAACPDDLAVEAGHPEARRKSSTPAKRSPNAGNIGESTSFEAEGTKRALYRIDCGFVGVCERRTR